VADKDYGEFHHFTYTQFAKGTKVATFKRELSKAEAAALDEANKRLMNCGPRFIGYEGQETAKMAVVAEGGGKAVVLERAGNGAVTSLVVKVDLPADIEQQRRILREVAIAMYWDGEQEPSVWSPLGDFFGTGPGVNLYRSLPLGMTEDGFYSNWYMPFGDGARIEVFHEGEEAVSLDFEITVAPLMRAVESLGRFHAKWHRDAFLPKEKERWIDWTMLKTAGRGRFCGVQLEVWNPRGGWWGEGDEKFFVDGEKFPSTYGTGSEDYFGYAWSDPTLWENCYHNQTISEGNKGHVSVNRWHIGDNVPFQKSFEGCIEKYWSNERPTQYACTVYWYQAAGQSDPYEAVPAAERVDFYTPLSYPLEVAGMVVLEEPAGPGVEAQGMHAFTMDTWTNNEQLWWTGEKDAKLRIRVSVEQDGQYKILTRLTKAVDYGIVQFYIDETKLGEPIDLFYRDGVIATDELNLGKVDLAARDHVLTVHMVGANPDAVKRYMFGMDYLKVERVR
jgi:hypothetical protein